METPVSPMVRGAPHSSIPVFWRGSTDDLDAWLRKDTAGYPKAKQFPFLVVSLCFFYLPWKALARQYLLRAEEGSL